MLNSKIDKDTLKFVIPLTEPKSIKQALDTLGVTKATRLGGISAKCLKTAFSVICRPLSTITIINLSMKSGKFPDKQCKIKKG